MSQLPITPENAATATRYLKKNFGEAMESATKGTPFTPDLLCAIACQETAYFWLPLIDRVSPENLLGRCVLDGSGDVPATTRSAFPRNAAAFRAVYGDEFTDMLISEANATRRLRGFGNKTWLYKGYGIFQYDLQFVKTDEAFFRERKWYSFDACLSNVLHELRTTYARHKGSITAAVRAYNGTGARATAYARNVMEVYYPIAGKIRV